MCAEIDERLTIAPRPEGADVNVQQRIATRAVAHVPPAAVVNLGIGIPTFVADHLPLDSVALQTENGLLGVGPTPGPGETDPDLVHAGKQPVTARPGASYFASSTSFGMIRGGHVDVAVLGALQVDARGRIANWAVPGRPVLGSRGAMDLLVGAGTVVVTITHTAKDGSPKIVAATYPLTVERPVDIVVTEAATFRVSDGGLVLVEIVDGVTLDWVHAHTTAPYAVELKEKSDA